VGDYAKRLAGFNAYRPLSRADKRKLKLVMLMIKNSAHILQIETIYGRTDS